MSGLVARMRRHLRQRTLGQSFVEFALILPVFLLFVAATLDLGRVFYANITLNNAAREGAYQAAKTPDLYRANQPCDEATNRVVCRVQNETAGSMVTINPTDIQMSCGMVGCPKQFGSNVKVTVHGSFRLLTPLLTMVFGGQNLALTSSSTAQVEYFPDIRTATPPPAPVANFTASPLTVDVGVPVSFDSSLSTGDPTGYQWDFDGNGVVDSTDPMPTYTYSAAGVYAVSLTVVNLTGVDIEMKTSYITVNAGAGGPPPPPPPPPGCVHPPNLTGMSLSNAQITLQGAGFNSVTVTYVTTGAKGKVQGQNPDATQCVPLTTTVELVYRNP